MVSVHPDYGNVIHRAILSSQENRHRPMDSIRCSTLCRLLDNTGALTCERRAVFEIALPMLREPFSEELLTVFAKGHEEEEAVKLRLRQMGYNVDVSQRRYDTGESVLPVTGSSDFELGGDLCECKSVGANAWAGVLAAVHSDGGTKCADGYLASYWRQLQLYMNLGGYDRGILLFSNRDRVAMAQEEHEVNRYWFDAAMESAGRIRWLCAPVIALLRDGAEPDSLEVQDALPPHDRECCSDSCAFRAACKPGRVYVQDGDILFGDLEAQIASYVAERDMAKAAKSTWEEVKDRLKERLLALPPDVTRYVFEVASPNVAVSCSFVQPNGRAGYWKIDEPKEAQ